MEEEFFKAFEIEGDLEEYCSTYYCTNVDRNEFITEDSACKNCPEFTSVHVYPLIDDEILLELICILSGHNISFKATDVTSLKDEVMAILIDNKDSDIIRIKVKKLFGEIV